MMLLPERNLVHLLQQIVRRTLGRHKHEARIHRRLLRPDIVSLFVLCVVFEIILTRHLAHDDGVIDDRTILGKVLSPVDRFGTVNHRNGDGFFRIANRQRADVGTHSIGQGRMLCLRGWCIGRLAVEGWGAIDFDQP